MSLSEEMMRSVTSQTLPPFCTIEMWAEKAGQLEAYCDKLAEGLPEGMLPKDIELINETNVKLLVEIEQLRGENSALRANTSKSVLRRLKAQGALGSECD